MFEKEAEEIEKEAIKWVKDVFPNDEFKQSGISRALVEFAKLGYNKANKWHYVKDGDLPKENENVLIYSNRANLIGVYRNGFWFTNSDGCLEDDDIEVIAWKEIVLPKEIEEK